MKPEALNLVLLATALLCISSPLYGEDPAKLAHRDKATGIEFPAELAGMEFKGIQDYGTPALGYGARYELGTRAKADIYIYDNDITEIPNGFGNPYVQRELSEIPVGLRALEERGYYSSVNHVADGVVPETGPIRFAWSKFTFSERNRGASKDTKSYVSEAFVTGFNRVFVKIRITVAAADTGNLSEQVLNRVVGLLNRAANPGGEHKVSFELAVNAELDADPAAAWLCYLLARQGYILEHKTDYGMMPGIIEKRFGDELAGRSSMARIWSEFQAKDSSKKDPYLDDLALVEKEGWMKEYVWHFFAQPDWITPEGLRLEAFRQWALKMIPKHRLESYGTISVKLTADTAPEASWPEPPVAKEKP